MDLGDPTSYLTLRHGVEVLSSDGAHVGRVDRVVADAEQDVFDGLVIHTHFGPGGQRFVDAEQVGELYERAVVLRIPAEDIKELPRP